MKVHRVTLLIVDTDNIGADDVRDVIENAHYPNRCIAPSVAAIETREVDWSDDHPLNRADTQDAEFARLFAPPPDDGPRCGRVDRLRLTRSPHEDPARFGPCILRAGHAGMHRSDRGVEWSP
jgi:hypothetical protein